ncbi:MAG: peptidoglycan recognition protein family protein, partial [Ardenticatenaceae bacterium]
MGMRLVGVVVRLVGLLALAWWMARLGVGTAQYLLPQGEVVVQDQESIPRYREAWHFASAEDVQGGLFEGARWDDRRGFVSLEEDRAAGLVAHYLSPPLYASEAVQAVVAEWALQAPVSPDAEGTPAAEDAVRLALRWQTGGQWGAWVEFSEDHEMPAQDASFSTPLLVPGATVLQWRVEIAPGPPQGHEVRRVTIGVLDLREGDTVVEAAAEAAPLPGNGPSVIPRRAWGAREEAVRWEPEPNQPRAIVVHHTATSRGGGDPAAVVRAIDVYHRVTRGWGDIGYHYLIDHKGNIYDGRLGGPESVGAHAYDFNEGTIGIALIGTYDRAPITPAARQSLLSLMAWLSQRYSIEPRGKTEFFGRSYATIMGHRDTGRRTTCPGDQLESELEQLRQMVAQLRAGESPLLPPGIELAPSTAWANKTVTVTLSHLEVRPVNVTLELDAQKLPVEAGALVVPIDTTTLQDGEHLVQATLSDGEAVARSRHLLHIDNSVPLIERGTPSTPDEVVMSLRDGWSGVAGIAVRRQDAAGNWGKWRAIDGPFPAARYDHKLRFEDAAAFQWRVVDRAGNVAESEIVQPISPAPHGGAFPRTPPAT